METDKNLSSLDTRFYQDAETFFSANIPYGLTYDDVSLATLYSEVLPSDTNLETRLSDSLQLHIPIISADMDTVTESAMAIGMALQGGLGLIHYNMSEADQVKAVARVKNHIHGLIRDPIKASPDQTIEDILKLIEAKGFSFSTFPVVDERGTLVGLLPGQIVKERHKAKTVQEVMSPRDQVHTIAESALGENPISTADTFFNEHMDIHKLLVVDDRDCLCGLFTLSDIERITGESHNRFKVARDERFRLICGAAVSAARTAADKVDQRRLIDHVGNLVDEGVDAIAISTAHGHTLGVGESVRLLRNAFPSLTLIAGNVTSAAGVEFLAEAGASAIKVGQGPGSICTTRVVTGVGIPQLTALYVASCAAVKKGVAIIADGGITQSGDIVKALTLADAVMCGGLLAGCKEAPGKIVEINGKLYKEYRGMGSIQAMQDGSAARYGHTQSRKVAAEGVEALKEVSGSLDSALTPLVGGIQSGMGYLGAADLQSLKRRVRYIRVTAAGLNEARPHDVIEVKTTKGTH